MGEIPWGAHARSKPNHRLYFEVVLGAIALDKATDELVRIFGEDEERSRPDGKRAAIGSILVDNKGLVLEERGVAISSFAWALKPALELRSESLGAWPKVEPRIVELLDGMVRRQDENGEPVPIDLDVVHKAHRWLVSQFGVPAHLVEPPTFALKVFHHFKARTPPEPSLLNSFYLEDLGEAVDLIGTGGGGAGLRHYLGIGRPDEKVDVLSSPATIEPFVAPSLMPQARWPSQGGHPLVLLQQAAVNAARAELGNSSGIIGVNGPPGTGKTTLLRDIHTFQGREADTVILLMGAPKASQHRARQWAASPPNIINVAVSRAKQNLYVVGSAASWAGAGTSLQVLQGQLARSRPGGPI